MPRNSGTSSEVNCPPKCVHLPVTEGGELGEFLQNKKGAPESAFDGSEKLIEKSVGAAGDRGDVCDVEVPWEEDPSVLRHFSDEGVDQFAALRLGVNGGEVGAGEHFANDASGVAGVHEIVNDQDLTAIAGEIEDRLGDFLENLDARLVLVVVALAGDGFDGADVQFTRNDGGWNETATGNGDDGVERTHAGEAPCESAAVAVELIPGDRKILLIIGAQSCSPGGRRPRN